MAHNCIWKYQLKITDKQEIHIPRDARLMSCGLDPEGQVCIWLLVDAEQKEPKIHVEVIIRGTGHKLPCVGTFIGTVCQAPYVWHVFTGQGFAFTRGSDLHYLTKDNGHD